MSLPREDLGEIRCPLDDGRMEYDEAGEEVLRHNEPCEAPLYLIYALTVPLYKDGEDFSPENATTGSWQVECENGHVIALSAGEEYAEPFSLDIIRPIGRKES